MILYFLKFTLLLGVALCGYQLYFGKDKRFAFNRIYLLVTLAFSLFFPLVSLDAVFERAGEDWVDQSHNRMEGGSFGQIVEDATSRVEIAVVSGYTSSWVYVVYGLGFLFFIVRFIGNISRLFSRIRRAQHQISELYVLALSDEKTSPFSFGKYIVVNKAEYTEGCISQQVMEHEIAHVMYKHSIDRILMEVLLILLWFHPFVWMYKWLIECNHEYAADDYVLQRYDAHTYGYQLLAYLEGSHVPMPSSGINFKQIKNRIQMMKKLKTPNARYFPVLVLFLLFFALSAFTVQLIDKGDVASDRSSFVVLVDVGHGGRDTGATVASTGTAEKDLVLAIASAIRDESAGSTTKVVFTRSDDQEVTLSKRVSLVQDFGADLLISLHINSHDDTKNQGVELYVSEKNQTPELSRAYAMQVAKTFMPGDAGMAGIKSADFYVLREAGCPALLLNLGYMSNPSDLDYLQNPSNQQQIARNILDSVEQIALMKQ
ncbi:MAG: M56/M15 family metallopeptidase [Cyclobacteriaceae bacterium]|nr:M56/M15 family metallopeptidase [Cyclobacteriaceae bacterium]